MVSMTAIMGFVGGMKTATDITKTLIDLKVTGEVQAKIVELQSAIMTAQCSAMESQQEQFALQVRVTELEQELDRLARIGAERVNYQVKEVDPGCFAYMLKAEARQSDTAMWFCVPCFDSGYKQVLQSTGEDGASRYRYSCPKCSNFFAVRSRVSPAWID